MSAEAHADLLSRIVDEMEANIIKGKEAALRVRDMRQAMKEARKATHKARLAALHAAEKELAKAATEKAAKHAGEKVKKAKEAYHSGLKKIHMKYRPGGGSYNY